MRSRWGVLSTWFASSCCEVLIAGELKVESSRRGQDLCDSMSRRCNE
jgi:hypothetical protein